MVTVIKRQKAHFRIDIRDLNTGKIRTISLLNHDKNSVDDVKAMIIHCLESNNINQRKQSLKTSNHNQIQHQDKNN